MSYFGMTNDDAREDILSRVGVEERGRIESALAIGGKRSGICGTFTVKSIDWRQGWVHWCEKMPPVSIKYFLVEMWAPGTGGGAAAGGETCDA